MPDKAPKAKAVRKRPATPKLKAPVIEAPAPEPEVQAPVDNIGILLALEEPIIAQAASHEASDNSDAVKYTLRAVAKAISTLRNAIKTKGDLER